ncbi:hypothetical protein BTR23_13160 [Alkalihalophilus pseudofirmus]|nr:hypothetical protein BTR23_13160 [Alkalihalophilus pseudofirmus]
MLNQKRVAVVTGAGRGIGQAIVRKLALDGYKVYGIDKRYISEHDPNQDLQTISYVEVDVTDPNCIRDVFENIYSQNGRLDILVNNAAITNNISAIAKMDIDKWQKELDVNLNGVFYCTKYALKYMVQKKWGRIVNISSMAGRSGLDRQSSYAASKAGVLGLTKNVTIEYAEHGIACNAILPGLINTEAVQSMLPTIRDEAMNSIPANRFGETEEVAQLVSFLVSDQAGYINGIEIPIDGGSHCNPITLARTKK